jgi:type IV fimbrial biogenesis protein FimT
MDGCGISGLRLLVWIVFFCIHLVQSIAGHSLMNRPCKPSTQRRDKCKLQGLTLLEALVVMAVLAVLLSLAAPAMTGMRARHQLQSQAEAFLNSMVVARSEALRRQQRVGVCARGDSDSCDASARWHQGWLVFVDSNNSGWREAGEVLIEAREAVPKGVTVSVTNTVKTYYAYNSEGRSASVSGAFMAGTWRFCSTTSPQGWQVVANALGKPRIEAYPVAQCP